MFTDDFGRSVSQYRTQVLVNASASPDARSRSGVNRGEVLCARSIKPFDVALAVAVDAG
jgi:hypothetical protein